MPPSSHSLEVLREGGVLVTILPVGYEDDARRAAELGVRPEPLLVEADDAGMRAVAEPAEKGQLRAHVDATFPPAEAGKAHAHGETDRTTGKLVLTVR